jgi:hypothetical protein
MDMQCSHDYRICGLHRMNAQFVDKRTDRVWPKAIREDQKKAQLGPTKAVQIVCFYRGGYGSLQMPDSACDVAAFEVDPGENK